MKQFLGLLPFLLMTAAGILISRDKDNKGPDDAIGQICSALAPVLPDMLSDESANSNATLKAMRLIAATANAYIVAAESQASQNVGG